MSEVKWLLVGTGDIANKRVAPALNGVKNSRLVGVCDVVRKRAEKLACEVRASEVFTDLDEALARSSANAVYLATPIFLHAPQTIKALEAGKHVLVEKPLGLTGQDARKVAEAARGKNLKAGCSYFRRLSPRYLQAKTMLQNSEFGKVVLVRMTYFSWFNPDKNDPKYWRVIRSKSGGGPLSDMGSHMFDVLIGLFGMPVKVFAKCENLIHSWDVEDSAAILMTLQNGAQVVASFNWNSKTCSHEFEIIGTEAKVKWHPYDAGKVIKTVARDIMELDLPNAENVHAPLIEDFVQAVIENRNPAVTLEDAARTNILLDAVYRSAETGKEVEL
ncbi:MAG: Gfo/Idh/MocA family oxidoreductase [Phycisphaerae bacterium]